MKKQIVFLLFCFFCLSFSKQETSFSMNSLTGRGDLQLFGSGHRLQKEAHEAFVNMQKSALESGIKIKVVSSYRSYERQKGIWNRKYKTFLEDGLTPIDAISKIIEYSTIPGTSRHHWGTDIDIIDEAMSRPKSALKFEHFEGSGVYVKLKNWLDSNASKFGFCLVYTNQEDRKGFKYEPWHYSFMSISKPMLSAYKDVDIKTLLKKDKLLGREYFTDSFINKYISENIFDINPDLK